MFHRRQLMISRSWLSLLLLAGCSATPSPVAQAPGTETASDDAVLTVDDAQLQPAFEPSVHEYEVDSLNTLQPLTVRLTSRNATSASLDGQDLPLNGSLSLRLDQLSTERDLTLQVRYGSRTETYTVHTLPKQFPAIEISQPAAAAVAPGYTFIAPGDWSGKNPSHLILLDPALKPVYYRQSSESLSDFKRQVLPDGSVRYTYFEQTHPNTMPKVGYAEGKIHVLDQHLQERQVLSLLPATASGERYPDLSADSHDSLLLGPNDYLLETYLGKEVDNVPADLLVHPGKVKVAAAIIQEVRNGQVVMQWDSTHYPEFYRNAGIYANYDNSTGDYYDYMHINSIAVDPRDQNLIVSFRHQNQIVKLERLTGRILWRLGGKNSDFALTPAQRFSHQHDASLLPNGDLLLFDNANPPDDAPGTGHTQVMRFRLDEAAHKVTDFQAWQPYDNLYGFAMGSAQILANGNLMIGWGANTDSPDVTETDAGGRVLQSLKFGENIYSYRAFKYPAL